jgi:single-strand DNA-binding protein
MATLNKVMLIGRLTDNPEPPRTLPNSGSTVVKFRFAVGKSKKNPQTGQWENDPNPLYIDCEAFSYPDSKFRLTDLITNYARKGSQLYIEGRLQLDQWDDKTTGQKRSKHKIVVEHIQLLDGRQDGGGGEDGEPQAASRPANRSAGAPAKPARSYGPPPEDPGEAPASSGGEDSEIPF